MGDVPKGLREQYCSFEWVIWKGTVKRELIPAICRSSHFYLPCEINAACPNSLIEAMACGTPTVGYDTGSIAELVGEQAGIVVPYGANDQKLQPADANSCAIAAGKVIHNNLEYRTRARQRAEEHFDAKVMVQKYIQVLAE